MYTYYFTDIWAHDEYIGHEFIFPYRYLVRTPVQITIGNKETGCNQRKLKLVKRKALSPPVAMKFFHTVKWVIKYICLMFMLI